LWGLRNFTRPPYGTLLKLEASGQKDGQERKMSLQLYHPDGYMFTAIPTVACLLQILDGTARKPGLWCQAHIVEPGRFLEEMKRLGIASATE
jgi:saccharopine dehydrogenase (NAD+, L-lysine-forming)